jgi:hypothetical protein
MEEFLKQIGLLGGNAAGAGYGQSGVGPGGMGANNGLSQAQQPMFQTTMTPEQQQQMAQKMALASGTEMLKQPEQQPKAPPPPIQQQQQQPQMPMEQTLDEILARYGISTEEQQPQATWGGLGGGGFRNG